MTKAEIIENSYRAAEAKLRAYIRAHADEMRPSKVRNMVLRQVCALPKPFTADQLVKACIPDRISVGTIYNSLKLFIDAHIVQGHTRQRGQMATEYELLTDHENRFQMICTACGRLVELDDKAITRLVTTRKYSNFNMAHFALYVYGECKICRRKVAQKAIQEANKNI